VYGGVKGVVQEPYRGAKSKGIPGFFQGLARGAVGIIVKPVSGLFDGASSITDGVAKGLPGINDHQAEV